MTAPNTETSQTKYALVTGGARRIGAAIVRALHTNGYCVGIHYRNSSEQAVALCAGLNELRMDSAHVFHADLAQIDDIETLFTRYRRWAGRLDVLINNASSFYPTPVGSVTVDQWNDLIGTNLRAPMFLSQLATPALTDAQGCIVNITDIHAQRPLHNHSVYGAAKAGLAMLTRSFAKDLAPAIRVNAIAPGAILWPEEGLTESVQQQILKQIPLARKGDPSDIAKTALFLIEDSPYITGQIIAVDGGRSLGW